jgi:hypothetical protein
MGSEVANFTPNENNVYNISDLPIGVYLVVARCKDMIITAKFIIVR